MSSNRHPISAVKRGRATASGTGIRGGGALATAQTVGAGVVGIGYIFYLVAAASQIADFGRLVDSWWLPTAVGVVAISGLALIALAVRGRPAVLGYVAVMSILLQAGVLGLWFLAWTPGGAVDDAHPTVAVWLTIVPVLAGIALVLSGRPILAVANLVIVGATCEAVSSLAWTGQLDDRFVAQAAWSVAYGLAYLLVAGTGVSVSRRLDQARITAQVTARDRVRQDSYDGDRRRLDALVHDRIIAFLLALRPGTPDQAVRSAAGAVIDELDQWWDTSATVAVEEDALDVVQRLRTTVAELGDAVEVRADLGPGARVRLPVAVGDALVDAASEAVRNFYRHAGLGASCFVIITADGGSVSVTIADDGVGFDTVAIPAGRLGLSFGIVDRMAAVPGGSSSILSAPGHGTRVRVRWEQP